MLVVQTHSVLKRSWDVELVSSLRHIFYSASGVKWNSSILRNKTSVQATKLHNCTIKIRKHSLTRSTFAGKQPEDEIEINGFSSAVPTIPLPWKARILGCNIHGHIGVGLQQSICYQGRSGDGHKWLGTSFGIHTTMTCWCIDSSDEDLVPYTICPTTNLRSQWHHGCRFSIIM